MLLGGGVLIKSWTIGVSMNNRNLKCWCGSNKKYKNCHLRVEEASRPRVHELESLLRKKLKRAKCMAPAAMLSECDKKIISAHTISRTSALKVIAREGHVYGPKPSAKSIEASGGRIVPRLVGVNEISVFNGFCKLHDSVLFKAIDNPDAEINSRFCTEIAFRSVAKELFLKQEVVYSSSEMIMFEKGMDQAAQMITRALLTMQANVAKSAERDLARAKKELDAALSGDDEIFIHQVFEVSGACPLLLSSCLNPEMTSCGKNLQDVSSLSSLLELVMFSSVPTSTGMAFILSANASHTLALEFIDSVVALEDRVPSYLIGLAFEKCENFAISPEWWEAVPEQIKNNLISAINRGIAPGEGQSSELNPLKLKDWDTGLKLICSRRIGRDAALKVN